MSEQSRVVAIAAAVAVGFLALRGRLGGSSSNPYAFFPPEPDWSGDGSSGGSFTDRFIPDFSGDGDPGGQLTDRFWFDEPDWNNDGTPGGDLVDRIPGVGGVQEEPDWSGDGDPGGNLTDRLRFW